MCIYNVKIKVIQLHKLKYKVPLEKTIKDSQDRLCWTWVGSTALRLYLSLSDDIRMTIIKYWDDVCLISTLQDTYENVLYMYYTHVICYIRTKLRQ